MAKRGQDSSVPSGDALMEGIKAQCQWYEEEILSFPQLDIGDEQSLDISLSLIDLNLWTHGAGFSNLINIPHEFLFNHYNRKSPAQSVLLSGPAGCGKSTFLCGYIFNWAKSQREAGYKKELIIYVQATTIKDDVWEAIYESTKVGKTELSDFIRRDIEDTYIFLDEVEKVHDQRILEKILHFVQECMEKNSLKVLLATRDVVGEIEKINFSRNVFIEGFSEEQVLEYIEQHIATPQEQDIVDYLKANINNPDIATIIKNPLQTYILRMAIKHGLLHDQDLKDLRVNQVYHYMEKMLNARALAKINSQDLPDSLLRENQNFSLMCLHRILKGKRVVTEDDLRRFNISDQCPMSDLLVRSQKGSEEAGYTYTGLHESYMDFCASQAILSLDENLRTPILLYICSRNELLNLQMLTYGALALREKEEKQNEASQLKELVSMLRYIILLQAKGKERDSDRDDQEDFDSESGPQEDTGSTAVTKETGEELECKDPLAQAITGFMKEFEEFLKGTGSSAQDFLQDDYASLQNLFTISEKLDKLVNEKFNKEIPTEDFKGRLHNFFSFFDDAIEGQLHRCLNQCLPWQLPHVWAATLDNMLPVTDDEGSLFYRIEGTSRWGRIDTNGVTIFAWSPNDATSLLKQTVEDTKVEPGSQEETSDERSVTFYCDRYRVIFGENLKDSYSQASWEELLRSPATGTYSRVRVNFYYPQFTYRIATDAKVEPERQHVLPLVQAVMAADAHLSGTKLKKVVAGGGFIYLSELAELLEIISQRLQVRVVLWQVYIVADETALADAERMGHIDSIKASEHVMCPWWVTSKGAKIEYMDDSD